MTHTPGPWRAAAREGDDWDSVVAIPGTPLEVCQCFHEAGNEDECEANAHLIAAAPDLLKALKACKTLLRYPTGDAQPSSYEAVYEAFEQAEAAIAKAEAAK